MLHTQTLVNLVINLCNISLYIISERAHCFFPRNPYTTTRWQHWVNFIHSPFVTMATQLAACTSDL